MRLHLTAQPSELPLAQKSASVSNTISSLTDSHQKAKVCEGLLLPQSHSPEAAGSGKQDLRV